MKYDVIIVGGAAAGLTAAIYSSRRSMKTLVITKNIGGQAVLTPGIENYPGYLKISGTELIQKFEEQAKKSGAEIVFDEVTEIKESKDGYSVKTISEKYETKAVILAFGKTPRSLGVSGEKEFSGKGVSYCSVCDMPIFKNKTIAVVGGGNSALDAALNGSEVAKKVFLIHRRNEFRGFEYMVERVKQKKNVELVLDSVVKEIKGDKFVKSVIVQNVQTNETREITLDGVFIEIGFEVKVDFIKDLVKIDENNQIVVCNSCETFYPNSENKRPGVFAAGDVTNVPFKQIVISAGDGAKSALQAYAYITKSKSLFMADWIHGKNDKK